MTIYSEDKSDAVRQLASGSTIGMVDAMLKRRGVGSAPRAEILEVAKRIVNRRARIKHLLIGIFGGLILVGGGYWYYICVVTQNHRVKIPAAIIGVGSLIAIYGLYSATQNEI